MTPSIGPIQLRSPFCQAGLAGYSDRAMRIVARRRGCPYAVTEALLDTIMLNGGMGLKKSIDINDEDHPVAGQIIGSEPESMARAATILAQRGYDVIDLNFACPVKKIKNKARGGHMLRDTARGIAILKAVRDALPPQTPTTISLRRGFDDSLESVDLFHEIVAAAWAYGYSAVRVHGRTVEQKYLSQSRWEFLRQVKEMYPQRTILGSGDVFTAEDAVRMLRETGVDIVWIARGAIGNPWIFEQARMLLQGSGFGVQGSVKGACGDAVRTPSPGTPGDGRDEGSVPNSQDVPAVRQGPHPNPLPAQRAREPEPVPAAFLNPEPRTLNPLLNPPSIHAQREALTEHFAIAMQIHGEQLAGRRMRKMGIKYARFHPSATEVKVNFINVRSLRDWNNVLNKWYAADGPGVWPDPRAADEVNESPETCNIA